MSERSWLENLLEEISVYLSEEQLDKLLAYLDELLSWNRKINLTSITDRRDAIEKHLVDALTLIPFVKEGGRILDLGSGGGIPGIPLKIACPGLEVVMVDAVQKKILFQRHACRILGLVGISSWHGRAENLPKQEEFCRGFDIVVSRAFSSLPDFVALAEPCLASTGKIIAMKGPEGEPELKACETGLLAFGVKSEKTIGLRLPSSKAIRTILVFSRVITPISSGKKTANH